MDRDERLPKGVKIFGNTENFTVSGKQEEFFGSVHPESKEKLCCFGGWCGTVLPGDILIIPAGIYHDVASVESECTLSCSYRVHPETMV